MLHPENLVNVEVLLGLKLSTYISGRSNYFEPDVANQITVRLFPSKVASIAFLMYDHLLMLPSEIQYVWQVNWGAGKVLYLLSRYPLLVFAPLGIRRITSHVVSETECRVLYSLIAYVLVFTVIISEIILIIRVWALWQRRIWVAGTFACSITTGAIIVLVDILKTTHSVTYVSDYLKVSLSYPACLAVGEDRTTSLISYVLIMANATAVFLLTAIVWVRSYRGIPFSSMMYTFYKDGLIYYAVLLATTIVNTIVSLTQPPQYINLLLTTQAVLHSVLSTRMLLNLRYSAQRDLSGVNSVLNTNTRHREHSITGLRFATGTDGSASAA